MPTTAVKATSQRDKTDDKALAGVSTATANNLQSASSSAGAIHLVGIGGAGMSALARMLAHRGFRVRGTDSTKSPETDRLINEGIDVHIGHTGEAISKEDALICLLYTSPSPRDTERSRMPSSA